MKRFITAIIWHSGCIMVSLSYLLPFTSIILKAQTISLGEAVDNDSLLWTTGGIADWFGQDSVYYYDGDAAQSGQLATREDSSWIQATVSGPGGLLFYWKFTGTLSLRFKLDGVKESICWTTYQWDSRTYIIQPGIHTLKWISSSTLGSNGGTGFLDKVVYIEEPPIPLGEAVDNESLTWTTGGDSDWVGQSMFSYYDGDAARSGNLRNGGDTSWIQAKVSGPGELSFYWKVTDITHLKFEINGVEKSICWADEEWELKSYILSPGTHILKWIYAPGSGCSGEAAFLDKV
jgi:hypothetical protein